jgi:hypothetical protein
VNKDGIGWFRPGSSQPVDVLRVAGVRDVSVGRDGTVYGVTSEGIVAWRPKDR